MNDNLGEFGFDFLKSLLKETSAEAKNYFVKYKVGFLPEGMDYTDYQKIKNKSIFKQLKFLIGNHPTLSIILIGLHISSLDRKLKNTLFEENKQAIYDKYRAKGVAIMNMTTTGFLEDYVKWLTKYNVDKNPSKQELIDVYENILEDWIERSIFIQGSTEPEIVINKIMGKMNTGKIVFFVFASRSAIKVMEMALSLIKVKEYGYHFITNILHESEMVWIFEKLEDSTTE